LTIGQIENSDSSYTVRGMDNERTYEAVIAKLGSQAALARALGKRQSTVAYWRHSGIPAEMAVRLEKKTGGEIPLWLSRPDLWPKPKGKNQNT
jgi:plasmid maintenance system antidote protein VapI